MNFNVITILAFALLNFTSCAGQKQNNMKEHQHNNLNCDLTTGICEVKTPASSGENVTNKPQEKTVKIIYFTDPICSSCWGIEPQLRLLKLQYGTSFEIEYRMGGLLPGWTNYNGGGIQSPSDVAVHWEDAGRYYEMPIDGDVWKENPLSSSFPPSIAFKAAELQDKEKAQMFLRRIKEMVFMEKEDISSAEVITKAAKQVGLNTTQLAEDIKGLGKQRFDEDLQLSAKMGVRGFPTLVFQNKDNETLRLYGSKPYSNFETILTTLDPTAKKALENITPAIILSHFPTFTTKEFAVLRSITVKEAEVELKQLLNDKKIKEQKSKNGPLWITQ